MPPESTDVAVGSLAPDFTLESNSGAQVALSDYRGQRNVLVYFMREFT